MTSIEVGEEIQTQHGWAYAVRIHRESGASSEHAVTLSFVDHDYWCGGRLPPSETITRVMRILLRDDRERAIPPRFDASTARRWRPTLDRELMDGD